MGGEINDRKNSANADQICSCQGSKHLSFTDSGLFKNLNFQSRFINRAAAYIFAVFALNNTLVSLIIEGISDINFQTPGGIAGFAILAGIVFLILVSCLLIGAVRELLLGKVDQKLICLATRFLRNPQHLNQNL